VQRGYILSFYLFIEQKNKTKNSWKETKFIKGKIILHQDNAHVGPSVIYIGKKNRQI
jgi:hypothetical protein